jgi:hypothetical protein
VQQPACHAAVGYLETGLLAGGQIQQCIRLSGDKGAHSCLLSVCCAEQGWQQMVGGCKTHPWQDWAAVCAALAPQGEQQQQLQEQLTEQAGRQLNQHDCVTPASNARNWSMLSHSATILLLAVLTDCSAGSIKLCLRLVSQVLSA